MKGSTKNSSFAGMFEKLTTPSGDEDIAVSYGLKYEIQETGNESRIRVAASEGAVTLLIKLTALIESPKFCLYVLLNPSSVNDAGRYQSPLIADFEDMEEFIRLYEEFFESDGRHNVWIGSTNGEYTFIYDKHDIIYCYGHLDEVEELLKGLSYESGSFEIPEEHTHEIHSGFNRLENEILHNWEWDYYPLEADDIID